MPLGGCRSRISQIFFTNYERSFTFEFSLLFTQPLPIMSLLILSIIIYIHPEWVNAHKTFGTKIDVCYNIKWSVDASDRCTRCPYLTHSLLVNIRTFPSWGQACLRILIASSVKQRYKRWSLTGLDVLIKTVDDKEGDFFPLADIMIYDSLARR